MDGRITGRHIDQLAVRRPAAKTLEILQCLGCLGLAGAEHHPRGAWLMMGERGCTLGRRGEREQGGLDWVYSKIEVRLTGDP